MEPEQVEVAEGVVGHQARVGLEVALEVAAVVAEVLVGSPEGEAVLAEVVVAEAGKDYERNLS